MKTIVIPDVHQRTQDVEKVLNENTYDEVVFLGDWFDSFWEPPNVSSFKETCTYLRDLIVSHKDRDKFVFLIGNHDLNYIHANNRESIRSSSKDLCYYCSGYTNNKSKIFRQVFFDHGYKDEFFLSNMKLAHKSQGVIISHAGIVPEIMPYGCDIDKFVDEVLPSALKEFRNLNYIHNNTMSWVGELRGGQNKVGGVLWLDWWGEFYSSDIVGDQIVGHTQIQDIGPQLNKNENTKSWNIDTGSKHFAVIENGSVTMCNT
jgi:hypothetical protein